jgi:hypothetical protein
MERVERIEDLDVRGFRAQGTVDAGGLIPTCTASSQPVVCYQTTPAGVRSRQQFFLPRKVLSRVFRGKFVDGLKRAFRHGKLGFHGRIRHLAKPKIFRVFLRSLFAKDWVVYAKKTFGGPEPVLHYLARYTHRVAISHHRLISMAADQVTFRWKDYAQGNNQPKMTIPAGEFLRRFFLHVLPRSLVPIRSFGFLANRSRAKLLPLCRELLAASLSPSSSPLTTVTTPSAATWRGPCCAGPMVLIEKLTANPIRLRSAEGLAHVDTS